MIAPALRMVALARLGARAKDLAVYGCTQAALAGLASLLALAAFVFALISAYFALLAEFEPPEAAGLVALGLVVLVLAVLGAMWFVSWRHSRSTPPPLFDGNPLEETAHAVQRGAHQAAGSIGPTKLLSLALIAGIAAGRRVGR